MSTVQFVLAGAAIGGAVGWLIALRFSREPRTVVVPPMPEEMIASDTAQHLAANVPAESAFEPVAHTLIERCAARVGLPCALVMRERMGAAAHIVAVAGGLDGRLLNLEVPLDSPAGRAITDGIPVVFAPDEKVVSIDRRDRRRYSGGGLAVPISQAGNVYGAVLAFGDPPGGTIEAVDRLTTEVRSFGPVLLPAYAAAVQGRRAETDDLTGLMNRRGFNVLIAGAGRIEKAALIVFDIDHFKDVNDTQGHAAGDAALKQVARLVREAIRPHDVAARIGGEEFAVWLPKADLKAGEEIAERLRATIAAAPFRYSGAERPITVSCGVAAWPDPTRAVENLMGNADAAMYQAKRAGRNRVVSNRAAAG